MVLTEGVPYKRTLLAHTRARHALLTTPLQLYACTATPAATQHDGAPHVYALPLRVPALRTLASLTLTHVDVDGDGASTAVYMQPLDGAGRTCGAPLLLCARCPARVCVPLHAAARVRILVVALHGGGQVALTGVRVGCAVMLASGGALDAHSTTAARLQRWRDTPRHLVACDGKHASDSDARSRAGATQHEVDDEPPQLLYANVAGGDDES